MSKRKQVHRVRSKKYPKIRNLCEEDFYRLVGVKNKTFILMVKILKEAEKKQKAQGGSPHTLGMEDRLLMSLEYLREYRTYFHLGQSYSLSESACYRSCRWVEDTLIQSRQFSLPGRRALRKSDTEFEVILIDATESPIERPKKNKSITTLVKRRNIR